MLRVLRAMRICGVAQTDARMAYVKAFCAYRLLRGQSQRRHVAEIMLVLLKDHSVEDCIIPEGQRPIDRATKTAEEDLRGQVLHMFK